MGSVRDCGSGRWRWWLRFRSVSCVIRVATRASASSWGRFSPLAVAAVVTLAGSGVLTAVLYLDALAELWTTAWGRTLALKVGLFAATGAVGAYNWRRLTPRLGDAPGTAALLRSARLELALAIVLLAVTAVLVHLAMPGEPG